ncbi:MAG: DUF3568 family protein [Planctomycetes bacterium]|nr:DUF3568 family protein [Planctomycetota bacterium]
MFKQVRFLALACALALSTAAGCHIDNKGVMHSFGTFSTLVSATPDQAIAAAREVAKEMQLTEVVYTANSVEGKLIATSADERTYEFTTFAKGDRVTDLAVRVGTTGDKEKSFQIIDAIKVKL